MNLYRRIRAAWRRWRLARIVRRFKKDTAIVRAKLAELRAAEDEARRA